MVDILIGRVNFEGYLFVMFFCVIEDVLVYGNFFGEYVDGKFKVKYEEGVFIGYRYFDCFEKFKVNFFFGYGFFYIIFEIISFMVS